MRLKCSVCGDKIQSCAYCGKPFQKNQTVICWKGRHFCDEICFIEYLLNKLNEESFAIADAEVE